MQKSALAFCNNSNSDDILMAMQQFMVQSEQERIQGGLDVYSFITRQYMYDLYKALKVDVDQVFDPNAEKHLRHPTLQKCLSLQAALLPKSGKENRTLPSKLAWTLLNIRNISLNYAYYFNSKNDQTSRFCIRSSCTWITDLYRRYLPFNGRWD